MKNQNRELQDKWIVHESGVASLVTVKMFAYGEFLVVFCIYHRQSLRADNDKANRISGPNPALSGSIYGHVKQSKRMLSENIIGESSSHRVIRPMELL